MENQSIFEKKGIEKNLKPGNSEGIIHPSVRFKACVNSHILCLISSRLHGRVPIIQMEGDGNETGRR